MVPGKNDELGVSAVFGIAVDEKAAALNVEDPVADDSGAGVQFGLDRQIVLES